jgi:uncharacterized protein with HEPN domain
VTRDARDRLEDILHAIVEIERRLAEELPDDALHDALCFQLLVIGEAVKHLDSETSRGAPDVAWEQIAGLRDVIVHEYFRIDLARIRDIVARDVPKLRAAVESLLRDA